ncbi:hypothetical protein [Streptomyces sp. NPDC091879]
MAIHAHLPTLRDGEISYAHLAKITKGGLGQRGYYVNFAPIAHLSEILN